MIKVTDLEVIFDNGGGVTVQCDEYCHYYEQDAAAAAADFKALLDGADPADWDGNDEDATVYPSDEQIGNGGYRVFNASAVAQIIEEGEIKASWRNVERFFSVLGCASNE